MRAFFSPRAAAAALLLTTSACAPPRDVTPPHPRAGAERPIAVSTGGPAPILGESAARVGFQRLTKFPDPGWHVPRSIHFAPDGAMVTFLASESQSDRMALFAADVATGAVRVLVRAEDLPARRGEMSQEEQLRRERQRSRLEGITEYRWAARAPVLVIPAGGDVVVRSEDGVLSRITETPSPEIDPQPCPTGERVAYVRDGDLFVFDRASARERRLTQGGPEGTTRGLSDFLAQEEFEESSGFFWSPDCKSIAYLEVDERGVDTIPVVGYRKSDPAVRMDQRYPRVGRPNPTVALRLVDVATARDRKVTLPAAVKSGADGDYLLRVTWSRDASALWLQALPRDQRARRLVRIDPARAAGDVVHQVTSTTWVEPSPFVIHPDGGSAYWIEPVAGDDGVVRLDLRGGASRTLTDPGFSTFDLHGLDATGTIVFATTNRSAVLGRQLDALAVGRDQAPRRLTAESGVHAVEVGAKGAAFVDVHSAADRMPEAVLRDAAGAVRARLPVGRDADLAALELRVPRPVQLTHEGTVLHGAVLPPRDHDPSRRYPLVLMVYGGPGVQTVLDRWSPRPLWQHLADRGFFVAQFDNRGTSGRGHGFASAIHGRMGLVELADQQAALAHLLAAEPSIDAQRVGIYGHSYGGFLAAFAMLSRPGLFRAGVAGSPVTDWRLYDSAYTERYMGPLVTGSEGGYATSRLPDLAAKLEGKLFLLHGLMDENVHVEHTAKLVDALVAADESFDLLLFPSERHGYRSPVARAYANRRVVDFLARELAP